MEIIYKCPVCSSTENHLFLKVKDHSVSREIFSIVQCNICAFKFTNPRPEDNNIGKYYESEESYIALLISSWFAIIGIFTSLISLFVAIAALFVSLGDNKVTEMIKKLFYKIIHIFKKKKNKE